MFTRILLSVTVGGTATFALFLVMQALVYPDRSSLPEEIGAVATVPTKIKKIMPHDLRLKIVTLRPFLPILPCDFPPFKMEKTKFPDKSFSQYGRLRTEINTVSPAISGVIDKDYSPVSKVPPPYPLIAAVRGLEGYVLLEFTVTEWGTVRDPRVIDAHPPGYFERAAIEAVLKFKYKPRIAGGQPVSVTGVQNRITFTLDDS